MLALWISGFYRARGKNWPGCAVPHEMPSVQPKQGLGHWAGVARPSKHRAVS